MQAEITSRTHLRSIAGLFVALVLSAFLAPAMAGHRKAYGAESTDSSSSTVVPAEGQIEVAFSPNEGSEHLVIKSIDSAHTSIRMLAYSFTSAPVVEALIRARHRGVDVKLVADQKENTSEDRSGKARAALSALLNAGADVRLVGVFPIAHDKTVICDEETVETGSFNYSAAAAHSNSENVLVVWHNRQLAAVYMNHFLRNYKLSTAFQPGY